MSSRHEKEKGVNVQVLLRCRPFSGDELRNKAPEVVTCNEYQREVSVSQSIAGKHFDRVFTFDKLCSSYSFVSSYNSDVSVVIFFFAAREDKLSADNRSTVSNFQAELTQQLSSLCDTLTISVSRQSDHLQCVEKLCNTFLEVHDKAAIDLKKKVNSSRVLYISHFEAVQNVARLHKASSNAALEEVSALASSNSRSLEEFLAAGAVEANSVFDDLQDALSSHRGETAHLARELRQRFTSSIEHLMNTSETIHEFLDKLFEESKSLERHAIEVDEIQTKSIIEFQKAYEEQSRSDAEKLIADMTTLVSVCMRRQKDMVDARLGDIKESVIGNKLFMDGHVSSMEGIAMDLKRKWQDSFKLAENNFKDSADFSAAKHCRMELLSQKCANTVETALKQWQRTQESLNDMGSQHASTIASRVRSICESNEQHDTEIDSARVMAEEDMTKHSENMIQCLDSMSEQERVCISEISATSRAHSETLECLRKDHSQQSGSIEQHSSDTFRMNYMDYEPTGTTPVRCEPDIPSKGTIESLRAMPMETLKEEFRENHSYESFRVKELKPSLIPRSPLSQIN
ncbi:kinesin-like protein KIN-5C [Olea europaea var. sylvestris]|uniref:kinesin-like protein KIN-5C n=1 Tax=Olea europaea var. sylvestris TaxID=158386 RepID=UPI000C1CE543|nr:kinesin-like protein KIN-5C [Olea europaea var. sylvestris]